MAKDKINWQFAMAQKLGLTKADRAGTIATHQGNSGIQRHRQYKFYHQACEVFMVNKANLTSVHVT